MRVGSGEWMRAKRGGHRKAIDRMRGIHKMGSEMRLETKAVFWEVCFWFAVIAIMALCLGCEGVTIGDPDDCDTCDGATSTPTPYVHGTCPYPAGPPMDLPRELRQSNYAGGSCMHASLISVLRWQGKHETAAWWRANYGGAAGVWDLARICRGRDFRFAWTTSGDAAFLQWCSDTRRGAAIHYFTGHAVTFCGYKKDAAGREVAVLLDNNRTGVYVRVPKAQFISPWRVYGGNALTVVYSPTPPKPWRSKT